MRETTTQDNLADENRPRLAERPGQEPVVVGHPAGRLSPLHLPPSNPPSTAKTGAVAVAKATKPKVTAKLPASQQAGPCHADCRHHAGRGDVSKSAKYRCVATLNGRKTGADACQPCLRELGHGEQA